MYGFTFNACSGPLHSSYIHHTAPSVFLFFTVKQVSFLTRAPLFQPHATPTGHPEGTSAGECPVDYGAHHEHGSSGALPGRRATLAARRRAQGGSHCATPTEKYTQEGFFPSRKRSCGTRAAAPISGYPAGPWNRIPRAASTRRTTLMDTPRRTRLKSSKVGSRRKGTLT